jgi:hypothetical protein
VNQRRSLERLTRPLPPDVCGSDPPKLVVHGFCQSFGPATAV